MGESVCLGRSNEQDVLNICVSLCVELLIAGIVNSILFCDNNMCCKMELYLAFVNDGG